MGRHGAAWTGSQGWAGSIKRSCPDRGRPQIGRAGRVTDAVTAVSGSGPAYVFLLAEAMEAAAREQGLSAEVARTLVLDTVLGAARMLTEADEAPAELRRRVTSPGGTTQAALETFQSGGFEALTARAIAAAARRGRELSAAND